MTDTAPHCRSMAPATRGDIAERGRRAAGMTLTASAMLLALAACQSEPAEPQASDEPVAETAAPTPPGAAQPVVEERLSTANCTTPAQDRVHFRVNNVVFAVPGDDVRTVVPPDVTPSTPAEQVVAMLREQTAAGAGCPEKPLSAGLLGVAGPAGAPLLADTIALFRSPPGSIGTPYGNLTREMLANSDRCQKGQGGLLACQATGQDGAQQTLYLVSTERNRTLAFGGPLAARCALMGEQIRGCEIVDELPGGVGLRVPLTALPQSSAALAAAHQAALAKVRELRR
jgi:hypothetical protein